jgi:chromosome segregation ATPase
LEYDRLKEDKSLLEVELGSQRAEINNTVRIYQDFCDRNLKLKKRENELQLAVNELEGKVTNLQQRFDKSLSELQDLTEDEKPHCSLKVEPSRTVIFDTKDLF